MVSEARSRDLDVGGRTRAELLSELRVANVAMNDYAISLFDDPGFTTSPEVRRVQIAIVSLQDIGLTRGATYAEILNYAEVAGLAPCSLEVAPVLRLNYLDQPPGPYLTVATVDRTEDPAIPNGFYLRHVEDTLWLRGYESGPDNLYEPDFTDFAFMVGESLVTC